MGLRKRWEAVIVAIDDTLRNIDLHGEPGKIECLCRGLGRSTIEASGHTLSTGTSANPVPELGTGNGYSSVRRAETAEVTQQFPTIDEQHRAYNDSLLDEYFDEQNKAETL